MLGEGRVTTNFGRVDVVLLQGAIVACYGGGEDDQQLRMNGRGAICGCHCSMLWWGEGRVMTNFGGGGGRGAIAGCHCSVLWWGQGRVMTNFGGGSGRGDCCVLFYQITSTLWWGQGRVMTNFGGGSGRGDCCVLFYQVETSVVWVLSMSKMLTVGRLPHDKVLRIIARPRLEDGTIQQWQVIVWTDFAETDIEAWRSRKNWQALKPRDDKAKRVADIALATPKTKYIKVKEELQSPGNIVPTHSVV